MNELKNELKKLEIKLLKWRTGVLKIGLQTCEHSIQVPVIQTQNATN